jgi:hypothetical protein
MLFEMHVPFSEKTGTGTIPQSETHLREMGVFHNELHFLEVISETVPRTKDTAVPSLPSCWLSLLSELSYIYNRTRKSHYVLQQIVFTYSNFERTRDFLADQDFTHFL